jgi:hypothetical protein
MSPLRPALRQRVFRLVLLAASAWLLVCVVISRENLWSRIEYRHVCHNCGAVRVTRSWTLLRMEGPPHIVRESSLAAEKLGLIERCDHSFIHMISREERLTLNPALAISEVVHINSAIDRLVNDENFASALGQLAAGREPATGIWANVCLYSLRPNNSNINAVLQMVAAKSQPAAIAAFLRSNAALNPPISETAPR